AGIAIYWGQNYNAGHLS
nr:EBChi=extracellular basic defense-related protein class III chitinase homolog {N-terminal} [Trichosanthes kirilowii, Maxim., var japonicum (Kitam.), Peptide Partial, 17 aa] [Trichosanthes kirilowii]